MSKYVIIGNGVAVRVADPHAGLPHVAASIAADLHGAGIRRKGIGLCPLRPGGERGVNVAALEVRQIIVRDVCAVIEAGQEAAVMNLDDIRRTCGIKLEALPFGMINDCHMNSP